MSERQPVRKGAAFPAPGRAATGRLDSWKEIATYLNRGTRTVQRWEREEGLPVRRLKHAKLGSVYAFRSELDGWWYSRGAALPSAVAGQARTKDLGAHDFYLRGRSFYYRYGPRDVEYAIQMFIQAIEGDACYALAYAGLADCWSYLYLYAGRKEGAREQADWASSKAVELAPASAQAHASRALALSLSLRDEEAEKAFETALRLDPNVFEAHYFYARHCFVRGQADKAVRLYEATMRVRPEDYQAPLLAAQIYDDLGRPADGKASRERGIRAAEWHLRLNPDDARAMYMAANGMAALGQKERAREWVERALGARPDDPMTLYNAGCIYSLLGCAEEAISCLEKAAGLGLAEKGWYEHDSNLDPLRGHPRFKALLERLG